MGGIFIDVWEKSNFWESFGSLKGANNVIFIQMSKFRNVNNNEYLVFPRDERTIRAQQPLLTESKVRKNEKS